MALETLKDVDQIDGFKIDRKQLNDFGESPEHIIIDDDLDIIAFQIQMGPINEFGVTGCQIDTILKTCHVILEKLNFKIPCQENESAIIHLERCIECLSQRKKQREARGVEGTDKA